MSSVTFVIWAPDFPLPSSVGSPQQEDLMAIMASPGADYVSIITKLQRLPPDQLSAIATQPSPEGQAAAWMIKSRDGYPGPMMGLDSRVSAGALAIPSSFPDSQVLQSIQGGGMTATAPPVNLMAQPTDRPTVAGAAPPPTRPADPPPAPAPVTPEPITPPAEQQAMGLAAMAPQVAAEQEDPERKDKGMALMQAGLAILASNSRSGLGAIGEGGLVGLQALQRSRSDRKREARDEKLMSRQEARDAQQTDMQIQKMELEKQLAEQRMQLAREEMDITRSRYDPSNPAVAASIDRDRAAAAASRASANRVGTAVGSSGSPSIDFGKSGKGLAVRRLVESGEMTPEEGARWMAQEKITGPNGELGMLRPGQTLETVRAPVLSSQEKDAIMEADKTAEASLGAKAALSEALALNDKAFSGPTAGTRAMLDRVIPGEFGGTATTEFKNIVENQALSQMKAIFGAAPTEGERKILMDLQASVDKSPKEREAILKRGMALAEQRAQREAARATGMREGTYFKEGLPAQNSPQSAAPSGNTRLVYDPATGEFKPK